MADQDRKLKWAFVVLLAVIAVELAWFLFVGAPPHPAAEPTTNQETHYWEWVWSAPFWTALFTLALTVSTALLWLVTRKTVKHGEASAKALLDAERPYITIEAERGDISATPPKLSFVVKNLGRTPAIVGTMQADFLASTTIPRPFSRTRDFDTVGMVLAPNQAQKLEWPNKRFSPEELAALESGTMALYFQAVVPYRHGSRKFLTGHCQRLRWPDCDSSTAGGTEHNYLT